MGTEQRYEFDEVSLLAPFAVGVPGKRTFFLAMGEKDHWLRVWLEKEHLQALAVAVEQLFLTLSQEKIDIPEETEEPPADEKPTGLPFAELDIVQMTLGYDQRKAVIELTVQKVGAQEQEPSEVYGRVTLAQLRQLGNRAAEVCAAGRPLCPRCGGPVDPAGHVCPAQN